MKKALRLTVLAAALAGAFPALAQSNAEVLNELKALRDRVADLERKLQAAEARTPREGQWGMTPEQVREFNRVSIKTEATEDNLEMWGIKGLTVSGYMDPTFIYNKRQKRAGFQFLNRQSDGFFYDTSYMGTASIDFTKETDSGSRFKLTLNPNRASGAVVDGSSIVQEASISVPLTDLQTRLMVGQVPDWSGYEYQQPTLNPFITHNLLFDLTLPTTYTGVGIDYTQGKWWVRSMIANVNGNVLQQGERAPALVYRVDYSKGEFDGFGFAGLHGKTTNYNLCADAACETFEKTSTHLFEIDGYFIRGDLTLQGQLSYGQQKQASIMPDANGNFRTAKWTGASGLIGYNVTPRLQLLARADYIRNNKNGGGLFGYTGYWDVYGIDGGYGDYRNGIGPDPTLGCDIDPTATGCDKGANRYALSFGLKYAFNANTTFKLEYRRDGASVPVFYDVNSGTYKKNNDLFGASVVLSF
ncbi:MAG TPA: DUF3138 family protein [Solimonas sp.]|nr:DUF3138 family protein [Solimonas sp.]